MNKYKILIIIYLISVLSPAIANLTGIDIQSLYRIPFLSIRWIDAAILIVFASFIQSLFVKSTTLADNKVLISLCFVFLLFETLQLVKSWGATDTGFQIAGAICTLSFFVLIDLLTFPMEEEKVVEILKFFGFYGSIVLTITNLYLFYSFLSGNIVYQDLDIRVAISVVGTKESVSTVTLVSLVYIYNLYYLPKSKKFFEKAVHAISIFSLFISLIITFHRGNLTTIMVLTLFYIGFFSKKPSQALGRIFGLAIFLCVGYLAFGGILRDKGYDPVEKLTDIVKFAVDVDNPDWDKGRSIPQEYAINAWKDNVWTGVGYNDLYHFGLPADMGAVHNFVIACLFYRGIIGTAIYLIILTIFFGNGVKFWKLMRRDERPDNDIFKLLIIVSFCWLIPFLTQDIIWEKYSLSIQFMYLGFITNIYRQRVSPSTANSIHLPSRA